MSARADTAGALLVLYGATTGRDGIGGASVLASQELGEEAADKRPSVQVGDPFTGKKLIEVSVELVERGLVVSLQDCGAAGLASSLSEMAADYGIDVHLDRVPLREDGHGAVGDHDLRDAGADGRGRRAGAARPRSKRCSTAGSSTTPRSARSPRRASFVRSGTATEVGAIPARFLTDECPRYVVERAPEHRRPRSSCPSSPAPPTSLLALLALRRAAVRAFVTRRYDQLVQSRTVRRPGLDAAVLRLRPSDRGLAVSLDGHGPLGSLDPFVGGAPAVLDAARNVACAGGEPLGFTDCLNFGNPEKPEIGWELAQAIEGMAQACEALGLPGRLRQRLALQRDRRPRDPADAGRRLRRPRRRRPRDSRRLARGRRDPPRSAGTPALRGLRVPGPLRGGRRGPAALDLAAEAALVRFSGDAGAALHRSSTTSPTAGSRSRSPRRRCIPARGAEARPRARSARARSARAAARSIARAPGRRARVRAARYPESTCGGSATVGGDEILGVTLAALRAAWEPAA